MRLQGKTIKQVLFSSLLELPFSPMFLKSLNFSGQTESNRGCLFGEETAGKDQGGNRRMR